MKSRLPRKLARNAAQGEEFPIGNRCMRASPCLMRDLLPGVFDLSLLRPETVGGGPAGRDREYYSGGHGDSQSRVERNLVEGRGWRIRVLTYRRALQSR